MIDFEIVLGFFSFDVLDRRKILGAKRLMDPLFNTEAHCNAIVA